MVKHFHADARFLLFMPFPSSRFGGNGIPGVNLTDMNYAEALEARVKLMFQSA